MVELYNKEGIIIEPAMVGIEIRNRTDLPPLIHRIKSQNFFGQYLNQHPDLFHFLV